MELDYAIVAAAGISAWTLLNLMGGERERRMREIKAAAHSTKTDAHPSAAPAPASTAAATSDPAGRPQGKSRPAAPAAPAAGRP